MSARLHRSALGWTAALSTLLWSAALAAQSPSTGAWIDANPARGAADASVHLRLVATPDGVEAIADNPFAGPVEVLLRAASQTPLRSDPALPARATVPARSSVVVARLFADNDRRQHVRTSLQLHSVPGATGAQPRDVEYVYPLRGAPVRVTQGFGGGFSHADAENRHAVDFAAPEGTPVVAARAGRVMQREAQVSDNAASTGTNADDPARTNFIRILHDDGTMALYAHLQHDGVVVEPGVRVSRGAVIGFSGNTGASTGPHLHFVVQANHSLRLVSVPFRMFGPGGILRFGEAPTQPDR